MSLLLSLFFLSLLAGATSLPAVGVTYTRDPTSSSPQLPSPEIVAKFVKDLKISSVRLPESDPQVIRAFSYSNVSLLLSIPNAIVPAMAENRSNAVQWLYRHVLPFYPRARISTISVGNDVLGASADLSDFLLPAIKNLHAALGDLGIKKVSVSTTFSFINIMTSSFPPSSAEFQEPAAGLIIKPLLKFLEETNSSFLINLYPYNIYRLNSDIPIGFALFQEHPFNFRDDLTTGVRYRNLFDMMVDSVITALAVAGHENIPVTVTETGWPSADEVTDVDASKVYAEMYLKGLVRHLKSGMGTPLRREGVAEAYVYELIDQEEKKGMDSNSKRRWGILYSNMTRKYDIDFSDSVRVFEGRGLIRMVVSCLSLVSVALFLQ